MRQFDFTPLRRSTIGFDRLFDVLEQASRIEWDEGYPPFDLEKADEDSYRVTLAVAGFRPDEIEIVANQNVLTVSGRKNEAEGGGRFLHRGIAARAFERRFELADFMRVETARFEDGLLIIELRRELPEAMKPRRIPIGGPANDQARIEAPKQAA